MTRPARIIAIAAAVALAAGAVVLVRQTPRIEKARRL